MDESSTELLKEVFNALVAAHSLGPLALVGTLVLFSLRLFKHFAPTVWGALPWYAKLGLPFVLAFTGTLLTVGTAGGVLPALGAAFTAGIAAIGAHHGSKALGKQVASPSTLIVPITPMREAALKLLLDAKAPALPRNVIFLKKP